MRAAVCVLTAMLAAHSGWSQSAVAPNGNGTMPAVNSAPVGSEQNPLRVSGGLMAGHILYKGVPAYPPMTKDAHVSGAVAMSVLVDRESKVVKATIISGPEVLRESTLAAVRQWTYKPFLLNGEPVFVQTTVTIHVSFGAPPETVR